MTTKLGGVPITGFMTTTDDVDIYPTHLDELGKGGLHSEQNLVGRDLITAERRSEGMLCYIIDDFALYQLSGGILNIDWVLIFTIIDGDVVINQTLPENYIFTGDKDSNVIKSPVLLDTRLDLLRVKAADFILGHPNEQLLSAQVLSHLQNGYMYNNNGTVTINGSIPSTDLTLTDGMVFLGDINNKASEVQRLEFDNMPTFLTADPLLLLGAYNIITGSINPLTLGEPSQTLALQQCNMSNLTVGKIWFGAAILPTEDPLNFGFNRPKEVDKLPHDFIEVPFNKVLIGNVLDRAAAVYRIELNNMATLTFNTIWRGNLSGEPQESTSLTELEVKVDIIETITIPAIEADLLALDLAVAAIELEIVGIQAELVLIDAAILVIQGQIFVIGGQIQDILARLGHLENNVIPDLQDQIDALVLVDISLQNQINNINTTITNLRLNNILADADVSFYGFKLIDLADPVNGTDGVNLQTMKEYRPYIHIYKNFNLLITSAIQNTPVKAICNTTLGLSRSFNMISDNTMEYIGLIPLVMHVAASILIKFTTGQSKQTLGIHMYKNSVRIDGSSNSERSDKNYSVNISSNSLVELVTGDIIEMYVSSSKTTSIVVIRTSITITAA